MDSSERGVRGPAGAGMVHQPRIGGRRGGSRRLTALKIIGVLAWAGLWVATIGWVVGWR